MTADRTGLAGRQVLVVRPLRQDDEFVDCLRAAGARVHHCPVMAIEPLPEAARDALVPGVARADSLILVSKPAAELAIELFRRHQLHPAVLFAVGESTAVALQNAGYAVRYPQEPTSEGVLALPELQQVSGQRIMILRGDTGRDAMRDTLGGRGAIVDYGTLYRRLTLYAHRRQIRELLSRRALDVVVVHSVAVLNSLLAQLDSEGLRRFQQLPVLVPGARVGSAVRAQGVETVIEAASALPGDMVEALRGCYTSG